MRSQSGKWKVESGNASSINRSRCAITFPLSHFPFRRGFTLIELLISIAIIATLSAMFLGASRAAMEQSRASRTKTTISKLHTLLMEQWNSYETRRVDLNQSTQNAIDAMPSATPAQAKAKAEQTNAMRLQATRELMKFEMPDKWSDVTGVQTGTATTDPEFLQRIKDLPTLSKIYRRRYGSTSATAGFEGAECLYMIIMYACGDGESRTMFSAQDIGDVDQDGAPEFLDGWGRPIAFIRWPAGFVGTSAVMTGNPQADHDPFDPFKIDTAAYRLVPLIYSLGPDEKTGLVLLNDTSMIMNINPYFKNSDGFQNGSLAVDDDGKRTTEHIDNLHNHLQEAR